MIEGEEGKAAISVFDRTVRSGNYADGFKVLTCCLPSKISMVRAPAAQGGSGKVNYELYA